MCKGFLHQSFKNLYAQTKREVRASLFVIRGDCKRQ